MPQLLLVAGTGRNSGKTTLLCSVIRNICQSNKVTAIKITPHFHQEYSNGNTIAEEKGLFVMEEKQKEGGKDSSLMLGAGAEKAYFAMASEQKVLQAFRFIANLIPENHAVVCESGGLRHFIEPGLFLMMNRSDRTEFKTDTMQLKILADQWITFNGETLDFDPDTIQFSANKWITTPKY